MSLLGSATQAALLCYHLSVTTWERSPHRRRISHSDCRSAARPALRIIFGVVIIATLLFYGRTPQSARRRDGFIRVSQDGA